MQHEGKRTTLPGARYGQLMRRIRRHNHGLVSWNSNELTLGGLHALFPGEWIQSLRPWVAMHGGFRAREPGLTHQSSLSLRQVFGQL